jgi:hypothetical protein
MKTTIKPLLLIIGIAISLACADYWYNDYKSLFYPETADLPNPKKDRSFYYSAQLYFSYDSYVFDGDMSNSDYLDSLNIDSWYESLNKKINRNAIQEGMYGDNPKFINSLQSIGQSNAAKYVTILKRIDTLKAKEEYWEEPGIAADVPNLILAEKELASLQSKTTLPWLKDRMLYARIKALRFASKNKDAIALYEKEGKNQQPGLISDLTRSLYAGAFFPSDKNRSYYEFSKMLNAPRLAYHGPFNVRVYDMVFNDTVLTHCKSNAEKANVHAIAAMQPKQNLPFHIRKVNNYDPNHPYLQLLVSRMINKYEDFYHVNNDKDRYWWSPEDSISYLLPNGALDSVMNVAFDITKTKNVYSEPFYAQAMAHLFYTKGDIQMSKLWNSMVITKTPAQTRQKYTQDILNYLAEPKEEKLNKDLLAKIEFLNTMQYGRDVHVMQTISKGLNQYFATDTVKAFYAISLAAVSNSWSDDGSTFVHDRWEQQQFIDTISTKTLKAVIKHLESRKYDTIDSTLMKLSNLSPDKLYLAYSRRLMMEHEWIEAQKYFNKMSPKYFNQRLNGLDAYFGFDEKLVSYEEPILWLKSHKQIPIKDHRKFLDRLVALKKQALQKPNDAKVLYDFALQQYNLSYFGSAWIYCKSHKSVSEQISPVSDVNSYYGCDHVAKTLDHAINFAGNNKELHAQIVYLRALVEDAQAFVEVSAIYPENYWSMNEDEQKIIENKANKLIADKYSKYGQYLIDKVADSEYKQMIIRECEDIRKLVKK